MTRLSSAPRSRSRKHASRNAGASIDESAFRPSARLFVRALSCCICAGSLAWASRTHELHRLIANEGNSVNWHQVRHAPSVGSVTLDRRPVRDCAAQASCRLVPLRRAAWAGGEESPAGSLLLNSSEGEHHGCTHKVPSPCSEIKVLTTSWGACSKYEQSPRQAAVGLIDP
jgi:hypothetical protein